MDLFNRIRLTLSLRKKIPLPPVELQNVIGGGNFELVGGHLAEYFIKHCNLKASEKILDVGCGCGRVAIPLTRYITKRGCLAGLDIDKAAIDWCNSNIHTYYPNFHFYHADIFNSQYNPAGTVFTKDYRFPFRDEVFDFVYLTSVFTHLTQEEIEHYFSEIHRVLKIDGRWLATFYLFNNEMQQEEYQGPIEYREGNNIVFKLDFKFDHGVYRIVDLENPSFQVSYDEIYLRSLYQAHNFSIQEPIRYGSWSRGKMSLDFQDSIIARKMK